MLTRDHHIPRGGIELNGFQDQADCETPQNGIDCMAYYYVPYRAEKKTNNICSVSQTRTSVILLQPLLGTRTSTTSTASASSTEVGREATP